MKLELLDIPGASDQQLAAALRWRDGAWSAQTKALIRKFNAHGLDLNEGWAGEPCAWQCPSCGRTKSEIARLSDAGVLLCHLELHHDHLKDWAKRLLRARNPEPKDVAGEAALQSAFRAAKGLLERFFDTLVCKDCNLAEGIAKALVQDAPRDFSFSPSEIARFVKPRAHQQHEIDAKAAAAVWEEVRDDVLDRLAFVELLADRIAAGRHRRQGKPPRYTSGGSTPELVLSLASAQDRSRLHALPMQLADRSVRRDGFSARRLVQRGPVRPPTDAEWAQLQSSQFPTSGWTLAPVDWRCPACARDRKAIARRSNANKWTARLHQHVVLEPETSWVALDWRGGWDEQSVIYGDHQVVWLCQDCRQVITDVKTRDPSLGDYCLFVDHLQGLVGEVPAHTRPNVDLEEALRLARGNIAGAEAATDYFRHRARCASLFSRRKMAQEMLGLSAELALNWLVVRLEEEGEVVELERLAWELEEGERFAARPPALRADAA